MSLKRIYALVIITNLPPTAIRYVIDEPGSLIGLLYGKYRQLLIAKHGDRMGRNRAWILISGRVRKIQRVLSASVASGTSNGQGRSLSILQSVH